MRRHRPAPNPEASSLFEAAHLFDGLTPSELGAVQQLMTQKFYRAGEVLLARGEPSNEMMLILQGCASVLVRNAQGQDVRLAGVRRGAIVGEVGFLDGSPRSASVVAQEDMMVATLTRESYEQLCRTHPEIAPKLVANIAIALAARLRHANDLSLARTRAH